MPPKKLSVDEIKAVAEAAITAQHELSAAKKALEEQGGDDESLKTALETAEQKAKETKEKADALSQNESQRKTPEQIAKMKRKKAIIERELRDAGELSDEDEDDDDSDFDEDPDRPVTFKDLQRIERQKATESALQMAQAIEDGVARDAVKEALKRIMPSGDPAKDFRDAVSIANRDKNNKILEELGRRVEVSSHQSGSGAPPRKADAEFTPTAEEAKYMKPPFNMTSKEILAYRKQVEAAQT